ncbi:transcriptional regulator opi1 [Coemansia sp. RSA 455]|nr:transcriptional regulator opi1 [Coemansia sp. S680]KAJ2258713.1 transcriptional regulator opi1 [Coemansia sp. RSA 455]
MSDSAESVNSKVNYSGITPGDTGGEEGARESTSLASARVSIAGLVNNNDDRTTAAEALGILRGSGDEDSQRFIQRVQAIPIVNSAIGIYDRSRQSSALLRAGTSVIESGVRKMCQPITKRIDVAQLDSFACRQLDNLGYAEDSSQQPLLANLRKRTKDQAEEPPPPPSDEAYDNGKGKAPAATDGPNTDSNRWRVGNLVASARDRAVAYREDSVRRLRYCLEWLSYATALLRQHIEDLRRLLASLQEAARMAFNRHSTPQIMAPNAEQQPDVLGPADAAERLQRAKHGIVGAVRKAVAVVSNYAGSVLPGEARRQVRDLILNLPGRWASVHTARSTTGSCSPSVASDTTTPGSPPGHSRHASDASPAHIDANVRRTLAFATESFHMLDNVRAVFQGLYTNAERWIGAPPVQVPAENTQYRDPPVPSQPAFAESSAWQRPRRRLPLATHAEPMLPSSQSLADIGERMRRMDVDYTDDYDDAVSFKRNRTREPTPTHVYK